MSEELDREARELIEKAHESLLGKWGPVLGPETHKPYFQKLLRQVDADKHRLQPAPENVFRAFKMTPPNTVRVILCGQDVYPVGADGLAFSSDVLTPSLKVIFEALRREGYERTRTRLDDWAEQGVLLLNTALTTVTGVVGAHMSIGWDRFVRAAMSHLFVRRKNLPIMLWGKSAADLVLTTEAWGNQFMIRAVHPAALKHNSTLEFKPRFQEVNDHLGQYGKERIKWGD